MSKKSAELQAVQRTDMTRRQWIWKEMKNNKVAYAMVAPYMILFSIFTILPVVLSVVISFTDFNMLQIPNIVWLDNYVRLFLEDDIFLIAANVTNVDSIPGKRHGTIARRTRFNVVLTIISHWVRIEPTPL